MLSLTFILTICIFSCDSDHLKLNVDGKNIRDRIYAPDGYHWIDEKNHSFGAFLQKLPLKEDGSKILDYNNKEINNQSEHVAIIDYDIGKKDLQQCADAAIRLHAEYLFKQKKYSQIAYHFTNGDIFKWDDFKNGYRTQLINSNKIVFEKTAQYDDSYRNFRKYLDQIFMYAGTISLNKETIKVTKTKLIKTGDIIVTPGSPGHAAIILGTAINDQGDLIYLLGQGYTPAQSIHIITNPYNKSINPWYKLDISQKSTITARYTFENTNIRSFKIK